MIVLYTLLVSVLCLPVVSFATEYRVLHSDWIPEANYVQAIDPILSPSEEMLGVVCLKFDRLEILLYDRDTLITIIFNPDPYISEFPASMANLVRGDTIVFYIDYDIGFYDSDSTILEKVTLVGNSVSFDTASYTIPVMWNCRGRQPHRQVVRFEKDEQGRPIRLIVEKHMTYYNFSSGGAEWWEEDMSINLFVDLNSLDLLEHFSFPFMEPATLSASPNRQFAGFGMHYLNFNEPFSSGYYKFSSMQLLDSIGQTVFQVVFTYGDQWLAVLDATSQYSYDEVIYYGVNSGLDGAHPPAEWNLSCYNFSSGSPVEVWHRPISGIQPDYIFERASVLMAWRGDSTLLFVNASNGDIFDSTVILSHPSIKKAFGYWSDSPLHAAVLVGDSVMVLEFDAIVDVPSDEPLTPSAFTLSQNYPNPFNATTEISFSLARTGDVRLTVYNLLGQEVKTLLDEKTTAGEHRVTWDGRDNSSNLCATGIYLYLLQNENTTQARKMVMLK
ncbi:MAG: T9SS type A sorting domain-containing protein [bacterium]|nr:T9SS type A sorting domain-containing protein [bacterium]